MCHQTWNSWEISHFARGGVRAGVNHFTLIRKSAQIWLVTPTMLAYSTRACKSLSNGKILWHSCVVGISHGLSPPNAWHIVKLTTGSPKCVQWVNNRTVTTLSKKCFNKLVGIVLAMRVLIKALTSWLLRSLENMRNNTLACMGIFTRACSAQQRLSKIFIIELLVDGPFPQGYNLRGLYIFYPKAVELSIYCALASNSYHYCLGDNCGGRYLF